MNSINVIIHVQLNKQSVHVVTEIEEVPDIYL